MLLTVLFGSCFLILAFSFRRLSGSFASPGVVFTLVFSALYFWNRLGVLRYSYDFEARHAAYLLSTILVFGTAALAGMSLRRPRWATQALTPVVNLPPPQFILVIIILGSCGGMMWAGGVIYGHGGIEALLQQNMNEIRNSFASQRTGVIAQIGSILYGLALPGFLTGLISWLCRRTRQDWMLLAALLILAGVMFTVSFSTGGRQAVLVLGLASAAVILYGQPRRWIWRRTLIFASAFVPTLLLGAWYFLLVAGQRAQYGGLTEGFFLSLTDSRLKDWYAYGVAPFLSDRQSLIVITTHNYFAFNLTQLAVWIDGISQADLGWGRFQAVHLTRQLSKLGIDASFQVAIAPYYKGVINWPTGIGSAIADFGLLGAQIWIGFLGWLAGRQYGKLVRGRATSSFVWSSIAFVCIVYAVMYSPLQETLILYGLCWTIVLQFVPRGAVRTRNNWYRLQLVNRRYGVE